MVGLIAEVIAFIGDIRIVTRSYGGKRTNLSSGENCPRLRVYFAGLTI